MKRFRNILLVSQGAPGEAEACERALAGSTQRRSAPGGALLVPRCSALLIPGARPEGATTRPASGAAHWPAASRSPG